MTTKKTATANALTPWSRSERFVSAIVKEDANLLDLTNGALNVLDVLPLARRLLARRIMPRRARSACSSWRRSFGRVLEIGSREKETAHSWMALAGGSSFFGGRCTCRAGRVGYLLARITDEHFALIKHQPIDADFREHTMDCVHVITGGVSASRENTGQGSRRNLQTSGKILLREICPLHNFTNTVFHFSKPYIVILIDEREWMGKGGRRTADHD